MPSFGMFGNGIMPGDQPQLPPIPAPPGQPAPQQKHGMFGGGFGKFLTNFILNYSAAQGNPASMSAIAAMQRQKLEEMRTAQEEQTYQRHRGDELEDYAKKQEIESRFTQPTQTDRYINELMDPNTPAERKKILSQVLLPPVMGVVNGAPVMIDRASTFSGGGSTKATPPAEAIAELKANPHSAAQFDEIFGQGAAAGILGSGGPTPPASGSFPR